jgi:hypothetical protein
MSGENPGIVITLCNASQVQRIVNTLDEYRATDWTFHIFADEADELCYYKKNTAIRTVFEDLRQKCTRIYGITATGYEQLLCEPELLRDSVIVLTPKDGYKGPLQLSYKILPHNAVSYGPKDDMEKILEKDPNLSFYFDELVACKIFNISHTNTSHPVMTLLKTTRYTAQHELVMGYLRTKYPNKFTVLIFNGEGVRLHHHSLIGRTVKINNHIFSEDQSMRGTHLLGNVTIQSTLQYLKNNGGAERFPRIVIISGDLADRGINFVSKDFIWHLTHAYILASNKKWNSVPYLVQALRLCGIYNDDIPLNVYTTQRIKETILNGYHFQKDKLFQLQIKMITDDVLRKRYLQNFAQDKRVVMDLLAEIPTCKKKIGKAKFSENPYVLNLVDCDDGGITLEDLTELKGCLTDTMKIGDDFVIDDHHRLATEMFPKWCNRREKSIIGKFMRQLNPDKTYTSDEIIALGIKKPLNLSTIKHSNTNNGYGMIMRKMGDTYKLYPELKEAFITYFKS